MFHVKIKWNIVYKYLKTKTFSRDTNILPQMYWNQIFFDLQLQQLGVWGITKLSNSWLQEKGIPKNVWMRHCFIYWDNLSEETTQDILQKKLN